MAKKPSLQTTSETPVPGVLPRRESVKSPAFFSVYANDVQVQLTPWDMRFILGALENPPTLDDPVVRINQLGELRISLQLAKALSKIMLDQINAYEERFGPVPEIPGILT